MTRRMRPSLALLLAATILSSAVSAATRTQTLLSLASHSGKGKHPKNVTTGLLVDGDFEGPSFFCFSYTVITQSRIKGKINVDVDVIDGDGARRLASWTNVPIQELDMSDPGPSNDPCQPEVEDPIEFNQGRASECLEVPGDLRDGDVLRYRFKFKKPAKFKTSFSSATIGGFVLPNLDAAGATLEEAKGVGLDHALDSLWAGGAGLAEPRSDSR